MHTVLSKSSSGSKKLSIEPFMEEIEPVVEKYEFEFVLIKNNIKEFSDSQDSAAKMETTDFKRNIALQV